MPLNLDLAESEAKIARARVHLEALKRELQIALKERRPYTVAFRKIDQYGGWYRLTFTLNEFAEHHLGCIVGDVVHNLRSALDYIVSALVVASGETISKKHQFPIYVDSDEYVKRVGNTSIALKKPSPVHGIKFGLREIWDLQPFHTKPHPAFNPLAIIHHFSNTDKHRMIAAGVPSWQGSYGEIISDIAVVERVVNTSIPQHWEPGKEYEIERVRFACAPADPPLYHARVTMGVDFFTPLEALPGMANIAIGDSFLQTACDYVAHIVDGFKAL